MTTPLNVLIVEDSPDDADLVVLQLKRDGFDPAWQRVDTAEAMGTALDGRRWDVVLSDYVMPRFSAPAALQVLQAKAADVPFIIVSGAVGEEMAVAAMKAGAQDYIRKDNLARLSAAIDRELREAVERRTRRRLEKEITEISANEQRRIGQDLHDSLGQDLTGIAFMVKLLQQKLAGKSLPEAADAEEIGARVRQAIIQTRTLARGLCPVEGDREGLMVALQTFATSVENLYGIACTLRCQRPLAMDDNVAATHLFHIAQEAVNNAIRHGEAKNIEIHIHETNDRVFFRIQDDGRGFAPPPADAAGVKGMGLNIMNQRARMIGGTLRVECLPEGGTAVTCAFRKPSPAGPN